MRSSWPRLHVRWRWLRRGKQDATLMVGALDSERDFLDVRDVCACYLQCLLRADRIPSGTIFNIASGQPRKVGDVLADLIDIAGVKVTVSTDPGRLRTAEIPLAAGKPGASAKRCWIGSPPSRGARP